MTSYVDPLFSDILDYDVVQIRTLSPVRTFWEKITLLHAENNRPRDKVFRDRLSRHYYDVYRLVKSGVADLAVENLPLLYDVIEHKKRYFRARWAKYEDAVPGTMKIYPHNALRERLIDDYKQMQHMLFGEIPSFDKIITVIKDLENRINRE